ncbi:small ribosomal subunit protein bS16m-like [Molossus nigricans]
MVQLPALLHKAYRGGRLTILLSLGSCTNRPFYHIVAAPNKYPGDGWHWIGCGVRLSKLVEKLLGLSGFFPLPPVLITNAERLRRKRAREILFASQKTDAKAAETKASWLQ